MDSPDFQIKVDGVDLEAFACLACGEAPTADVARRTLAHRDPLEPHCPVCGDLYRIRRADLRHLHGPDGASWVLGRVAYVGVIRVVGLAPPRWAHADCAVVRYPLRRRDPNRGREGGGTVVHQVHDVLTRPDLPPDPWGHGAIGAPGGFFGGFEATVEPDGAIRLPPHWVVEEPLLCLFASPVPGERCVRLYSATAWVETAAAMRRYGTPPPSQVLTVTADPTGRVTLPRDLLQAVGIEADVHIEGQVSWAEIWPQSAWQRATCPTGESRKTIWEGFSPWSVDLF